MRRYVKKNNAIRKMISECFPEFKGRTITVCDEIPQSPNTVDYEYCFYNVRQERKTNVQTTKDKRHLALLEYGFFGNAGKVLTIYKQDIDFVDLPTVEEELTRRELLVLSTYRNWGNPLRFNGNAPRELMTEANWQEAVQSLIAKGFIDKRKRVISPKGHNYYWMIIEDTGKGYDDHEKFFRNEITAQAC